MVWDSTPQGEYDECLLKARVLTARRPEFSLLETLLWTPDAGFWLLDEHLQRLRGSADYFDIPLDVGAIVADLDALESRLRADLREPAKAGTPARYKVRLLVDRSGRTTAEPAPLDDAYFREPVRLALASRAVDSADVFLFHKTSHREVYDAARAGCAEGDDVLLYNSNGEVTETCRANVAVRIDGQLWTPPVCCGLLAGTLRARLLAEGKLRERVIPLEMLQTCEELFSLNSVRGLQKACVV